jgi:methylmalonyl-CoA mutase N-terminal domain/subunit
MNENAKGSVKGTDKDPRRPSAAGGREVRFTTVSGESIAPLYAPDDVARVNFLSEIGYPGEFPYTRGSLRVSALPRIRTPDTIISWRRARQASPWRLTSPR